MTRILAIVMFACTLIASPSAADPICLRVPILGNVSASVTQSVDPAASLLFEAGYISLHDEHVLSLWPSWIKANWIEDRLIGRADHSSELSRPTSPIVINNFRLEKSRPAWDGIIVVRLPGLYPKTSIVSDVWHLAGYEDAGQK